MLRSEEELVIERVLRPSERVRLTRHVVVETETHEVEVRREELRVEREPVREGSYDAVTEAAGEEPLEIVLHEEQVVIEKRVVPRERVRVTKQLVVDQLAVSAELSREQISSITQ